VLNAACVSCHPAVAREWQASRHRQAYTNAAFRQALAVEPSAFCRGCHARHFAIASGRPGRELLRDDRVFDDPEVVELDLTRPGPVSWWVTYQRVATVGTGTVPAEATLESEVPLHAGVLP
jgi:hypothetical protein